tara:strand:- start:347 stop:1228 length:882 start_codon:yes stop_codon:yes gene_type:complete
VKLLILFILFSFFGFGQVLDNRNGDAFTDKPFFNQKFIFENQIKKLSGYYVYKKKGESMKATKYKYVYNFNKSGDLASTFETCPDDGTKDTIWNIYEYNAQNNLAVHKKTDQDGFTSVYYEYDSLDRVVSEEFKREIASDEDTSIRYLTFNKERLKYADFEGQTKRTRYNNYDLPYLDEFWNYNELGYIVERTERIKMTSDIYTYAYSYNEKGKLASIGKSSNSQDELIEELRFKYDELGNLLEKSIYKKGVFTTDIQIIYNSKSKLVSSIITRQVSTGFLMILRFNEFEFFN